MNPRIESGTRAMLALREAALAAGETPLGWKVGLGSPAAFERLGTDRPLAGFLLRSGLAGRRRGGRHLLVGQPQPGARGRRRDRRRRRHRERGAAIELVDTTPLSTDPDEILRTNIYHRHVILGPLHPGRAAGVTGRLLRDGEEIARSDDPEAVTGELGAVVRSVTDLLAGHVSPGDIIITGSVFAPVPVGPGRYVAELPPLGTLHVELTA